ncbi:hypothetical protein AYI69_g9765 [Smittium culicis]|uniref:Uncharacterized protein n=1 Tax=Smittium culicis TaxID=133412 RepID=A0A1R1XAF5_9FUNG|nr:hypothetical protein AYI69_g9765 [Smittium culicis]
MKLTFTGLILAAASVTSALSNTKADNGLTLEQQEKLAQEIFEKETFQEGLEHENSTALEKRQGYYYYGTTWYFNNPSPYSFIRTLYYPPTIYYGQRFQYLYTCYSWYRGYWGYDYSYRVYWNTDLVFRNYWFAQGYPYGYSMYRKGGKYYNYPRAAKWKKVNYD